MGKDIKTTTGGGIWGWVKRGFLAIAKSGAASETWRLIAPWVGAVMGAAVTALIGVAAQAPLLVVIVAALVAAAAAATFAVKVQTFLANRRQVRLQQSSENGASSALDGLERLTQAISEGIPIRHDPIGDMFRRMADRPPPPPRRDVSLGEAILYVLRGRWGLDFSGFDPHKDSYDLETIKWQFEERAEDGRVQVWGSDSWVEGRYTKVEPSEWKHLKIECQSLIEGRPRTTSKSDISPLEPHYNLMVNKAQIEEQFPDVPFTSDRLIREASQPSPPTPPPPPVEEEVEAPEPEDELEQGLYVGMIVLDAAKMETQHLIEIAIIGFNGSGRAACVSSVRGSVKVYFKTGKGDETDELDVPTPSLLTDRSNTDWMPNHTEFMIVLEQVLRPGVPERLVAAFDHGQIIFDLDDLVIQMKSCRRDEPDVFARLKLWNGAVLRRATGFSTHRQHKLKGQISLGGSNA